MLEFGNEMEVEAGKLVSCLPWIPYKERKRYVGPVYRPGLAYANHRVLRFLADRLERRAARDSVTV